MHGAGLINSYFLRPGTAFVEIFPCNFGTEHHRYYYWHPSHVEAQTYAFQLYVSDPARCRPSALAATPEGVRGVFSLYDISDMTIALDACIAEDTLDLSFNTGARCRYGPV